MENSHQTSYKKSVKKEKRGITMPRPKTKDELQIAEDTNYKKLIAMIENRASEEKEVPYDFSEDEKKKEAHWQRDKNLRDVLMHLNEWHLLLLEWIKNRDNGSNKPFLLHEIFLDLLWDIFFLYLYNKAHILFLINEQMVLSLKI